MLNLTQVPLVSQKNVNLRIVFKSMKKIASLVVLTFGLILIGLNFHGSQNPSSTEELNKSERVIENTEKSSASDLEIQRVNIPSIFRALLGLL